MLVQGVCARNARFGRHVRALTRSTVLLRACSSRKRKCQAYRHSIGAVGRVCGYAPRQQALFLLLTRDTGGVRACTEEGGEWATRYRSFADLSHSYSDDERGIPSPATRRAAAASSSAAPAASVGAGGGDRADNNVVDDNDDDKSNDNDVDVARSSSIPIGDARGDDAQDDVADVHQHGSLAHLTPGKC